MGIRNHRIGQHLLTLIRRYTQPKTKLATQVVNGRVAKAIRSLEAERKQNQFRYEELAQAQEEELAKAAGPASSQEVIHRYRPRWKKWVEDERRILTGLIARGAPHSQKLYRYRHQLEVVDEFEKTMMEDQWRN